jgi:hypothetical protein
MPSGSVMRSILHLWPVKIFNANATLEHGVETDFGALTWKQRHRIDPSIQVDCALGIVKCKDESKTLPMKFSSFHVSRDRKQFTIKLKGSQGPSCPIFAKVITHVGNKIDYDGGFIIVRKAPNVVRISFTGYFDLFPAYEMWAMVNRSNPVPLFGTLPSPGSSPVTHLDTYAWIRMPAKGSGLAVEHRMTKRWRTCLGSPRLHLHRWLGDARSEAANQNGHCERHLRFQDCRGHG